jgi:predicted ATPase
MIKSIYVDNFKALNDFRICLDPLTVLIGSNGSGKSTVLQAIELMCAFVKTDIHSYINERKWVMEDLKSRLSARRHMTFRTTFELTVDGELETIEWEFVLNVSKEKQKIVPVKEKITGLTRNRVLLKMNPDGFERYNWDKNEIEYFPSLSLGGSLLNTIDIEKDSVKFPSLTALKRFALGVDAFHLLSTEKIRENNLQESVVIGRAGEKLAGFIHRLSPGRREKLKQRLRKYIPFVGDIDTRIKGKSGLIEMNIAEIFKGMSKPVKIKSLHTSDGILRMMAISALAEIEKDSGAILLDEIEDGVNPYLSADLVSDLKELTERKKRQVIVTTHSSVLLDYFPAASIVFLWRDKQGAVHGGRMFENEEIKESLEYMYPGEVWINMKEEEIIEKLQG